MEGVDLGNGRHSRPWPRDVDATAPRMEMMAWCRNRRQTEEDSLFFCSPHAPDLIRYLFSSFIPLLAVKHLLCNSHSFVLSNRSVVEALARRHLHLHCYLSGVHCAALLHSLAEQSIRWPAHRKRLEQIIIIKGIEVTTPPRSSGIATTTIPSSHAADRHPSSTECLPFSLSTNFLT